MNSQLKSFHFTFIAPVEGLSFKPKDRGNIIHHLIFVFFIFSITLPAVIKDQFTALIIKFVIEDFTDPGLLKIRLTTTGLLLWFCLYKTSVSFRQ